MRLLLDTHALIWLFQGNRQMSEALLEQMYKADSLAISVASLWEIAIKKSIGKLDLDDSVSEYEHICHRGGIAILPISVGALERIQQLPDIHRDPFDRLLIASAAEEGMALVTNDEKIRRYDIPTMW